MSQPCLINGRSVSVEVIEGHTDDDLLGITWHSEVAEADPRSQDNIIPSESDSILGEDVIAVIRDSADDSIWRILHLSREALNTRATASSTSAGSPDQAASTPPSPSPYLITTIASDLPASFLHAHSLSHLPSYLNHPVVDGNPSIHIIVSTTSGTCLASTFTSDVLLPTLTLLGLPASRYCSHHTSSPDSIRTIIKTVVLPSALESIPQTIILLSGDGGIHSIINALLSKPHPSPPTSSLSSSSPTLHIPSSSSPTLQLRSSYQPPTLALLALGTGNAVASSLGLTSQTRTLGLHTLLHSSPPYPPLPIFRVLFHSPTHLNSSTVPTSSPHPAHAPLYGCAVLSYGFHATLISDSDTPALRPLGASRFQVAASKLLFPPSNSPPHTYHALLHTTPPLHPPSAPPPLTHAYILITPLSHLEKRFCISPAARPLHSSSTPPELRIVHVAAGVSGRHLSEIMQLAYDGGKHVTHPAVGYAAVEQVALRCDEQHERWRAVCVDGDVYVGASAGWVEVQMVRQSWRRERGIENREAMEEETEEQQERTTVVVRMVCGR